MSFFFDCSNDIFTKRTARGYDDRAGRVILNQAGANLVSEVSMITAWYCAEQKYCGFQKKVRFDTLRLIVIREGETDERIGISRG